MSSSLSRRMRAVVLLTCLAGITVGTAQPAAADPAPEDPATATQPAASTQQDAPEPDAPTQQDAPEPDAPARLDAPQPDAPAEPDAPQPDAPLQQDASKPEPPLQQDAPGQPDVTHQGVPTAQPTGSATPVAPAKPAAKPPKKPAGPAEVVSVVRSGGISGSLSVFTLVGTGTKQGAQILKLASSAEFRALRPKYVPQDTCCDRFSYKVEVEYRNGVKKKITVLQGAPNTPQVLLDVIRLMETLPTARPLVLTGFPFN